MIRWMSRAGLALLLWVSLVGQPVYAQPLGLGGARQEQPVQQGVLSSDNGRFVFGQISDSSKDQFMLDTATGRLWRVGESGKIGMFLKAIPYRDKEGVCTCLPDKLPSAEKGASVEKQQP